MGRVNLLYKDLTYTVRGILYTVHNYLGSYRNEKQYGDAIEQGCRVKKLRYEREKVLPVSFVGEKRGRNRLDFVIEDKIILELKVIPRVSKNDYHQCLRYLTSSNYELCLLVNFYPDSLQITRILNPNLLKKTSRRIIENP